jgi:transketolase
VRRAFADTLTALADRDERVIFLTGDLGFGTFEQFQAKHRDRYINVGVAEAALVNVAAGLASEGMRPFIYSIASFATGRPFEQLRVNVAYQGLPVVVVGAGGGYTYATSGVTHHAAEDLGLMALLPNITIVAPADPVELAQLMPQLLDIDGPAYLRIGRYGEPVVACVEEPRLGSARLVESGSAIAVLCIGDVLFGAKQACARLRERGIDAELLHFHTLKPLDTDRLTALATRHDKWLIVEEHHPVGGLHASIAVWASDQARAPRLRRLGPPDALVLGGPEREQLHRRYRMDADGIYEACVEILQRDPRSN